jgi:glycosyltransferase involved in cell wall biosynthesis
VSGKARLVRIYRALPSDAKPWVKRGWSFVGQVRRRARRLLSLRRSTGPVTPNHEAVHAVMSSTGYPLVSVIVPAHNEQAFLDDCIRSIVSQSLMSIECIVVDDASSDATLDIAADWATRDRRVVVVRHDVNRGLAGSRNSGLQLARGRFVTFLDADDFLFASSLADRSAHLLEATEASSEVVGVYCDWMPVPEAALLDEQVRPPVDKPDVDYLSCCAEIPFIATAPLLVREPLVNLGGFDARTTSSGCG